jgi:hypothetical protein
MVPPDSPLIALAQQGVEAVGHIIVVAPIAGSHQSEPSCGNWSNDQAKRAWSEAATTDSSNMHLADNDAHRWITQNHRQREYGRGRDDLRNVIDNQRHLRARSLTPPWRSPEWATTQLGRGGSYTLVPSLKKVAYPDKFKPGPIDRYDGFSNPKEFIHVYHMTIETAGGDNQVKANYLLTTLSSTARSWLINLLEGTIYNWDQLYAMFIGNFQGTYERPSTIETLRTIKKKHDESFQDYMKHFCNARNAISYIQDIEVINAFCDGVSDIKTVEEITMKKA